MSTYYKGSDLLKDRVIENYLRGFRLEKGIKHPISTKINKYNVNMIGCVNELNTSFYKIIIAERVGIRLIEMNSNHKNNEIGNLWNLIRSQSGTIRYNRVLKHALKNYAIDNQDLYNRLKREITKQQDRVSRNEKLMLGLLNDYGLGKVIGLIESLAGMKLTEHIFFYTSELGKDLAYGSNHEDTEDVKTYYNDIIDGYVEHIKSLCDNHGLSLDNEISEELTYTRELKAARIAANHEEAKTKKAEKKRDNAYALLAADASKIHQDINSDYTQKQYRMEYSTAVKLRREIELLGGTVWFISMTINSKINYLADNDIISGGITRAKWFVSEEDADAKVAELEKREDLQNHYIRKHKIMIDRLSLDSSVISEVKGNKVISQFSLDAEIQKTLKLLSDNYSLLDLEDGKALVVKKSFYYKNGYDAVGTDCSGYIYLAIHKNFGKNAADSEIKFICINSRTKNLWLMDRPCNLEITKDIELDNIKNSIDAKFNLDDYNIKPCLLTMDSKHLEYVFKMLNLEGQLIQAIYNGYKPTTLFNHGREGAFGVIEYTKTGNHYRYNRDMMTDLVDRLNTYKKSGLTEVYYIIAHGQTNSTFYGEKLKNKLGSSLKSITFMPYEEAVEAYKRIFDINSVDIYKIMKVDLI